MQLTQGMVLDQRYEVLRVLGDGQFATVYLARHTSLHSRWAVKVLSLEPFDFEQHDDIVNRFLSEGQIQAQLVHPNIVRVTDIVPHPVPALVMEYVEGPSLDRWLASRGPLQDPAEVQALFLPVLSAMGAVHAAGVVHRDLKPENILMGQDKDGRLMPKITDFGIAKVLDSVQVQTSKKKTAVATRMGTLHYMSPEQIAGDPDVGPASDIFALGAILYEIAMGSTAFDGGTDLEVMKAIVKGNYQAPERVVEQLDSRIGACIRTALAVEPAERFPSCEAFYAALSGQAALPPRPTRSVAVTRPPRPIERSAPRVVVKPPASGGATGTPARPCRVSRFPVAPC